MQLQENVLFICHSFVKVVIQWYYTTAKQTHTHTHTGTYAETCKKTDKEGVAVTEIFTLFLDTKPQTHTQTMGLSMCGCLCVCVYYSPPDQADVDTHAYTYTHTHMYMLTWLKAA